MMLGVKIGLWPGDCSSNGLTGYIWATCVIIYCCLIRNFCSIFLRRPWPFSPISNLLASYNQKIKYPGKIGGIEQRAKFNTCKGKMHTRITFCLHSNIFSRKLLVTVQHVSVGFLVLALAMFLAVMREKKCKHRIPRDYCVLRLEFCLPQTMFWCWCKAVPFDPQHHQLISWRTISNPPDDRYGLAVSAWFQPTHYPAGETPV